MLNRNYFELFDLPASFAIDRSQLDLNYRKLQSEIHPDRFAAASSAERLRSMQWATHANEAYQTLRSPIARARYLLQLHGVDTQEESNTAMPMDFLMQQMEWREAIEEARGAHDMGALDKLLRELGHEVRSQETILQSALDLERNYTAASDSVRKLAFLDKLRSEIEEAIEHIEQH